MKVVQYETIVALCNELDVEPELVREIRLRAPAQGEVLLYAVNEDGEKHLGDNGVRLEAFSIAVVRDSDDDEAPAPADLELVE